MGVTKERLSIIYQQLLQTREFKSYVPIMNGCDNFCSYCIVPYVRGREVHVAQSVFEEVDRLEQLGVKEITLLGQNVNSYHYVKDGKVIKFYDLLADIANRSSSIRWIRFESPHPKDFSDNLIDVIASEPKVARHLHIPAQSGSTEVLKLMNRKYSRQRYLELVYALKNKVSDLTLTTDVMVGFPGETEQDFQQTLDMMKEVQFLEAFMYYFNPREGTKAVTMAGQLPSEVRMSRLQQLIDLQRSITVAPKTKEQKVKQKF